MLRLFANQGLYELWRCSHHVAACVTKRRALSLISSAGQQHRPHILGRGFSTGFPVWKDALQPQMDKSEELDTVDLDKWKSVMRSQAASGEKVNEEDEASDDDGSQVPGGDSNLSSSLEATREMVTMWREAGKLVPQEINDEEVKILAELTTKSARKKYLKYLAIKEGHKRANKEKKLKKKAEKEAFKEQKKEQDDEEDDHTAWNLRRTFIRKYWDRSLDQVLAWRSAQAMMFDQPLVFDMSYATSMTRREVENTVSQLMEVEGRNRRATEPFHLHYCNLQKDGAYMQELLKRYGAERLDRLLITTTDRHHVDMFPHEQLVYLTADSPNVLRKFDHSKVYIIGALVDRSIQSGLSLANAKRLKLATARLPLDEFLHWDIGAKNLTLDQMIRIMLTMKDTGKWEEALQFVPQRKHDGFHQQRTQKVTTDYTVRGVSLHGYRQGEDRPVRPRSDGPSFQRSYKDDGLSKVRTSLKNSMERGKGAGRGRVWWDKE
ncbi:tRNA methyltransferase 10 homolog C [Notolabrus celidotus]|uniref:tRNA methyltransferase 10 homolog C n=1 Tax=Notolabrus celidotus TaxID=1203425 RepID=UPI00148F9BE6|nr:tRNA methyltransferase 10 homolog C [Notolabrus celidotus]